MTGDVLDGARLRAAAGGDVEAFEELVRAHTVALYRVALGITGSSAAAEDVVQESWIAAWRSLGRFRGESAVRTWLVRIVTTRALNAVRARTRRPTVPLDTDDGEPRPDLPVVADTGDVAERRRQAELVRAAVAALPERQREALVLRDLEGLPYQEVADVLGCSVPSVKSTLFRARRSLAVVLAPWHLGAPAPQGPEETP